MTNETKTPQAGEWWINSSGKIRYIIGVKLCGSIVYEDSTGWSFVNGSRDWSDWHHEPRCTGFDWVEPPAIDPGEGWELLKNGEVINVADEYFDKHNQKWCRTISGGLKVGGQFTAGAYRRRKPPAEVWPKYYVHSDATWRWYIKRLSESMSEHVSDDGIEDLEDDWGLYQDSLVESGAWIEVTEAEALARVKPIPNPLPALIPGIATDRMVDLFLSWRLPSDFQPDGGISFTSRSIHESWPTGTNLFTATQARGMIEHLLSVPEETSRVQPADPVIPKLTLAEARELALKTMSDIEETRRPVAAERVPDHRPAREVIREIVRLIADSSMTDEESADMAFQIGKQWLDDNPEDPPPFAKPFTDARSGMGILKDNAPVESPDDWVETTDPEYVLREEIDEVWYSVENIGSEWQQVYPSAGMKLGDSQYEKARCRRRDLPAPQPKTMDVSPGEGWRWVEKDEPWQEGDDCLICDGKYPHTHNCQCWRRRVIPEPKRIPVRLWVSADVRWGDRYIVSVKDGNPNPERHQEVKFDGSGFYVEGK